MARMERSGIRDSRRSHSDRIGESESGRIGEKEVGGALRTSPILLFPTRFSLTTSRGVAYEA